MRARDLHLDPRLAELRRELAHARAHGVELDTAWPPAVRNTLVGTTQWERAVYGGALIATRRA